VIIGKYTMHLICDCGAYSLDSDPAKRIRYQTLGHDGNEGVFLGHTHGECAAKARRAGWVLKPDGRCLSPECKADGRRLL
jgi:hypothetical protein